jgi:hypothetical protein
MVWQYRTFKFQAEGFWQGGQIDAAQLEEELNRLGEQGWELATIVVASVTRGKTKDIVAVLKRPSDT